MSTITDITVSKIYVLNVAPKTRVLDRFWYDTTNKILKKCVSTDQSKADAECWEPIGIDPSAVKVTVENGQGNSTTLDLQTYVSAVAEGLIEISGQVTNLNNTKADKTALATKQDKLNYYSEGDNVASITSETTNTNNVVAKNITLGGYSRNDNEDINVQHAVSINEDGFINVKKEYPNISDTLQTTIDGDTITIHSYKGEDSIDKKCVITGEGINMVGEEDSVSQSIITNYTNGVLSLGGTTSLAYVGGGSSGLTALGVDTPIERIFYNGLRYDDIDYSTGEPIETSMFFAGTKLRQEDGDIIFEKVIQGSLVDKELSEESLETHIPTSSAVVSYVDKQTTPIKEDIVNIQQTKANNGELYFNGGKITCSQKWKTNEPFSLLFTLKRPSIVYGGTESSNRKEAVYTSGNRNQDRGFTISMDDKYVGFYYHWKKTDNTQKYFGKPLNVQKYFDNKPHVWSYVFSGSVATLKIDGTTIGTNAVEDIAEDINTYPLTFEFPVGSVIVSRAKVFNFDITSADAPYTLVDYINGKDESPLLQTTQPVIDWHNLNSNTQSTTPTKGQSGTLELNCTEGSFPRIFENGTFKVGYTYYVKLSGKVLFPTGQRGTGLFLGLPTKTAEITNNLTGEVIISTPSNLKYLYGLGNGVEFDATIKFIPTETNTDDNCLFYFNTIETDSNSYVNVSVRCDSALLSLDDYSIEDKVLDISGNNNHATITGSVYGSKSGSVEKFVETVIGDVHEIVDDLRDEVNSLSQQITISTHTSTFTSSSTDITNIYTDESKAALPGRIMIQPKLSNVAPMYFGENVSDKTKAFPLYPDQVTDFYFEDINNFKVASDAVGDGCNFVIEWGVTNVVADIASAFTMYDDNGNKFKIKIANGGLVAEQLN